MRADRATALSRLLRKYDRLRAIQKDAIFDVRTTRSYSRTTRENWIRHGIEETGRIEDILPVVYAHATREQAEPAAGVRC